MRGERSNGESVRGSGVRVLVADDDARVRSFFRTLLEAADGVSSVLAVEDGAAAVRTGRAGHVDVAVLDLHMPRLDGIEAAQMLLALRPSMRIAIQSSDPDGLRARAHGLDLPLFGKLDFDSLLAWVEGQAVVDGSESTRPTPFARKVELGCTVCGYGIVSRTPPAHCPMCHALAAWAEPRPRYAGAAHERLTG